MGAGRVLCDDVLRYVDACALVYFQFHPRSVGRSIPTLRLGTSVLRQKWMTIIIVILHIDGGCLDIRPGTENNLSQRTMILAESFSSGIQIIYIL